MADEEQRQVELAQPFVRFGLLGQLPDGRRNGRQQVQVLVAQVVALLQRVHQDLQLPITCYTSFTTELRSKLGVDLVRDWIGSIFK